MKRTRLCLAAVAVAVALLGFGLAGCGGASGEGTVVKLRLPDFSQVFVSDQDKARAYLEDKFTVVEPEHVVSSSAYYVYSSAQCAEVCPTMDRATANTAGEAFDMPGEWALYGITPTTATLRVFGIDDEATNEELVTMLDNACGAKMAMAYTQLRETGDAYDRTIWVLTDGGVWISYDSKADYIVNFNVSSQEAGWMSETILAQRIADLNANPDSSLEDVYTLDNRQSE